MSTALEATMSAMSAGYRTIYLSGPIRILVPINHDQTGSKSSKLNSDASSETDPMGSKAQAVCHAEADNKLHQDDHIPESHQVCCILRPLEGADDDKMIVADKSDADSDTESVENNADGNNPDDASSPFCPYIPGNEIHLMTSGGTPIRAVISKYFPATLSCVMIVHFVEPPIFNNTSTCILKLYDRRFATSVRESAAFVTPWTPDLEMQYQEFVDCGDAGELFSYWDAEILCDREWFAASMPNHEKWRPEKWEAHLQWKSREMYDKEKKSYERMIDLQGQQVPKMLGHVVLNIQKDDINASTCTHTEDLDDEDQYARPVREIPGLLLELVHGFHLTQLNKHLPPSDWPSTIDTAIATLHRIQDCQILNSDVNTRSFIVDPISHKVKMIDFGNVWFREDFTTEREWQEWQTSVDEEGAVAMVMQNRLKRVTGRAIGYRQSERTRRLTYRFNLEAGPNEGGTEEEDAWVKEDSDFWFMDY